MVDDLANVWVRSRPSEGLHPGDDWGHHGWAKKSCLWWLENRVLAGFEDVKATFFVPVSRVSMIQKHDYESHFGAINETPRVAEFFRRVHRHPNYELAYHGTTHGVSATKSTLFIQEWEAFQSLQEAVTTTRRGMELFREVTGEYPKGGKYCGYASNAFSDQCIDICGFRWWCRYNNRGQVPEGSEREGDFEPAFFGHHRIVDLPTTMHGHVLWPIPPDACGARWLLAVARKYVFRKRELHRQLNFLLANQLPILIQEHSARSRTDGLPQTPNIVDDRHSLRTIFRKLGSRDVWYATCSEIAGYYRLRETCKLRMTETGNEFLVEDVTEEVDIELSIALSFAEHAISHVEIIAPDGKRYYGNLKKGCWVVSFLPKKGLYKIQTTWEG